MPNVGNKNDGKDVTTTCPQQSYNLCLTRNHNFGYSDKTVIHLMCGDNEVYFEKFTHSNSVYTFLS